MCEEQHYGCMTNSGNIHCPFILLSYQDSLPDSGQLFLIPWFHITKHYFAPGFAHVRACPFVDADEQIVFHPRLTSLADISHSQGVSVKAV